MKKTVLIACLLSLFSFALIGQTRLYPAGVKTLSGGAETAPRLFDGKTNTYIFPGWNAAYYPLRVVVDFGAPVNIQKVRLFDGAGIPVFRLYYVAGGQQIKAAEIRLDKYEAWVDVPANISAQQVILEIQDAQGDKPIGEVEFYGVAGGSPPLPPDTTTTAPPPVTPPATGARSAIGTNGFHWVRPDLIAPFSLYRIFSMWEWFEAEEGRFRFEPTSRGNGNYDTFLSDLKRRGIRPVLTLNTCPEWMRAQYPDASKALEYRPVKKGLDPAKPESYREFSRACFQVTARYGGKTWPASALLIDTVSQWGGGWPANTKRSGLGLLYAIEIWNEPDKWWVKNTPAYFEPEQYAAMLSAAYDGHEGRLGPGYGVKTADPNMVVVMGGLTNFDTTYLQRMFAWCYANRKDHRFPADVVNVHHYCNENDGLFQGFTKGVAPETAGVYEKLTAFKRLSDALCLRQNKTALPVWWTEFGYDTNKSSPQRVEAYDIFTTDQAQGIWLVRSYLEGLRAGYQEMCVYNLIDERNPAGGLFQSSGLATGEPDGMKPKASWNLVAEFSAAIGDATLRADLSTTDLRLLYFEGKVRRFFIAWLPTQSGNEAEMSGPGGKLRITEVPQIIVLK